MDNSSFWPAFWPNLASTVIGVVVGLPIALWINAKSNKTAIANRRADDSAALRHGILALLEGFVHNQKQLRTLIVTLAENKALFDLGLDTSAWDISKEQIVPLLKKPELARRVAFHFSTLIAQSRLSNLYLDQVAGVAAAIGGVEQTRAGLKAYLASKSTQLLTEGELLQNELKKELPTDSADA